MPETGLPVRLVDGDQGSDLIRRDPERVHEQRRVEFAEQLGHMPRVLFVFLRNEIGLVASVHLVFEPEPILQHLQVAAQCALVDLEIAIGIGIMQLPERASATMSELLDEKVQAVQLFVVHG